MAEKSALLKYLELKEREEKSPLIRLMDSKKERGQLLSSADMNEDRKIRDIRYESMKETVTPEEAADRVKSVSFRRLPQQTASQQFINQNDVNEKKVLSVPQNNREALAKNIAESDLASYRKKEAERAEEQKKIDEARPVSKVQEDLDDIDKNIKKAKKDALLGEFSMLAGNPYPREQATERLSWLEGERDKYADELEFSRYAEYEKLRKADDYEENSKYSTTAKSYKSNQAVASLKDYEDWQYEYINQNPAVVAAVESGGTDVSYLKQMSDDEVGMYNYLYKTGGKEAAEDYIDSLQNDLYVRKREQSVAKYSEFAKEHPILASAASVPMNALKGITYAAQAADDLFTGEADPNAPYNAAVYNTNAIRSSVSSLAEEKWGKAGSFAYGVGMSMADFLTAAGLTGGTGLSMLIMGSGAAADTTLSALDRGVDTNAALVLGAAAGVIEAITEKYSVDALFKGDWDEKSIKYILKNILTEGAEEGASAILNTAADILLSGDKSDWKLSVAAYMDEGYSEKEAFDLTLKDKIAELGLDVLGGAISGGLMSGGSVAINQTGKAAARADEKYSQFETLREAVKQDNARRDFEFTQDGIEQEGFVLPTAADTVKNTEAKAETDLDAGLKEDAAPRAKTYEETVLEKKIAKATTTAERSGLRLGVMDSDIKTAKSLGIRTGRNIVFYSDASEAGKSKDGYINRKTNTIYVNKDAGAQKATARVLGHELTHSIEGTEAYDLLEQKALESMIRKGINPDIERVRIKQLYERAGIDLATDEQVDGEIVAKYVEENLINNRAAIRELVRENPSAARKFKMALAKMLTRVTGNENYIDYKTIASFEKMIDDAAKEEAKAAEAEVPVTEAQPAEVSAAETKVRTEVPVAEKPVVRETPAAEAKTEGVKKPTFETAAAEESEQDTKSKADEPMPSGADEYLTAITQRHEAGELTDEEFEEAYTVYEEMRDTGVPFDKSSIMVEDVEGKIPEWVRTHIKEPISGKAQKEKSDEGVRYSVSGENASTASHSDLVKAKEMEKRGKDSETIRKATGWYRGYDGEWRFEVDDSSMKILFEGDIPNYLTLGELIEHPKLFSAYPQLKNVDVVFQNLTDGSFGNYNSQFDEINLDRSLKYDMAQLKASLIHEIQHAIQYIEGFTHGASPGYWERKIKNGFDSRRQAQKEEAARLWNQFNSVRESDPEFAEDMDRLKGIEPTVPRGEINWDTLEQIEEDPPEWKRFDAERDMLEKKYGAERVFDYLNLSHNISRLELNRGRNARELYFDTAGEIEARDTASRLNFNEDQRKNTRPDIDRKDVVFAENNTTNEGVQWSVSDEESRWSENKPFSQDIDSWVKNGKPDGEIFVLGMTGDVLQGLGAVENEIYINSDKVNKILDKHPEMSIAEIKKIPQILKNPVLVVKSRNNSTYRQNTRIVIFGSVKAKDGNNIMSVLDLRPIESGIVIDDMQKLSSAYTKDQNPADFIRSSEVLYADKKTTVRLLRSMDFEMPIELLRDGYIGSISYNNEVVNIEGAKFSDVINENNSVQYSVSEDESSAESPKSLQDVLPTQAMSRLRQAENNLLNSFKEYSGNKTEEFIAQMGKDIRSISDGFIRGEEDAETALNNLFEKYKSATTADEYLWQYTMFSKDIKQYTDQLNTIKRYADSRAKAATPEKARQNYTAEDAEKMFEARRDAQKNLDRVKARALLTEEDKLVIGQIKRGERTVDQLNPAEYNVEDIRAVAEAEMAFDEADKLISIYKKQIKAGYLSEAEDALKNIKSWKDKATLAYLRETIDRNFRDIIPDKAEADAFEKQYIKPVHKAEADKQRALSDYRERVKALGLKEKPAKGEFVSESYAVQLLGEAEDNIRILEKMRNPETKRDGKTLEEWKFAVENLWADNPSLDQTKIRNAVESFRQIYDDLLKQMNRVLLENGYPPVRYRSGYFPHFTIGSEDAVMAKFSRLFGIKLEVNPLPTSINGLTQDFKPGKSWFGHALERTGFDTVYDAVAGFEQYIGGVLDVIYHTKNIQKFRALASQIRWLSADEGMRKQHQDLLNNETLTEEQRENEIRKLYEDGRYRMSNLVQYLDEYTNRLANKKMRLDRSMEEAIGRKIYTVMQNLESRVAANMIGLNFGSALTNVIPLNQAGAIIGNRYVLRGLWDTMQNVKDKDGFVAMSDFLVNRRGSVALGRTGIQKFTDVTGIPMQFIDDIVSEAVVRAAYYKNLKSGMSEETALEHADEMAASIMADRSKGALPLLFDVKNPAAKLFTQFQVEVNNEFSVIFKDIPKEAKEKGVAMLAWLLFKYFVGAKIFNDIYEKVVGRRPAFDPLEMVNDAVGGLTGYQLPNVLDLFEGDAWVAEQKGINKAIPELAKSALSSLPFAGGVFGGGRVPIQSAFPDAEQTWNALTNDEWSANKRLLTLGKELVQPVAYLLPPAAGGFGKKLLDTAWTAGRGGAYNVSKEGEYGLQYPFYTDTAGEAVGNVLRSILSGPSTTTGGVEWVESGFSNLTTSETKVYKEMLTNGETQHKAWDTIWKLKKTSDDIEKCNIIAEANLSYGAARALFENKVTATQGDKIKTVTSAGVSFNDFLGLYAEYKRVNALSKDPLVKTAEFDKYVNKHFKSESQRNAITSVFEYSASTRSVKNYKKLIDAGIGEDHAFEIASAVDALEPIGEAQNVTSAQKSRAVIDAVPDDEDRMTALGVVLSDSDARKYRTAADMGVDADTYTAFREALPSYDADGNGSYTHAEIRSAIDAISGIMSPEQMIILLMSGQSLPESYALTNEQKAVMWQLATGSKSAKNNPYSVSAGEKVIKHLEALDNE